MIMFQADRCLRWLTEVFGENATRDVEERALRFGEESLELIQSLGITQEQAEALVAQVFAKPVGEVDQELGGTMVTLASLCAVARLNAGAAFSKEFDRVDTREMKMKIRGKASDPSVLRSPIARAQGLADVASISR